MKHRPYRWHWSHPGTAYGEYVHAERTVRLHPRLRKRKHHDALWETLGHELIHQIYQDNGANAAKERRAYKLEKQAAATIHDFYHRFRRAGLPLCNGDHCHINERHNRVRKRANRKR